MFVLDTTHPNVSDELFSEHKSDCPVVSISKDRSNGNCGFEGDGVCKIVVTENENYYRKALW
jgi:hypothetical protein